MGVFGGAICWLLFAGLSQILWGIGLLFCRLIPEIVFVGMCEELMVFGGIGKYFHICNCQKNIVSLQCRRCVNECVLLV